MEKATFLEQISRKMWDRDFTLQIAAREKDNENFEVSMIIPKEWVRYNDFPNGRFVVRSIKDRLERFVSGR